MICALHKGAFNISTSSRKKWLGQSIEDVKRKVTGIIGVEDVKGDIFILDFEEKNTSQELDVNSRGV